MRSSRFRLTPALSRGRGSSICLLLLLALTLPGCAKAPKKPTTKTEVQAKDDGPKSLEQQTINVGPGTGTYRADNAKRDPLWDVTWQTSQVQPAQDGNAVMERVTGKIYTDGKPSSDYQSDRGRADRKAQTLLLIGNVKVTSQDPEGVLTCDQLLYEAKSKRIKAKGNVRIVSKVGTVGTLSELWATPKLDIVATPDLFPKP